MKNRILPKLFVYVILLAFTSLDLIAQTCPVPPSQPKPGQTPEDICCAEASRLTNCLAGCNQDVLICRQNEQERDDELARLRRELRECRSENTVLIGTVRQLRIDSTELAQTVDRQRDTIKDHKKRIDVLFDSLRECNKVLANVRVFMNERQTAKSLAQTDLAIAKTIAEGYGNQSEEDKEKTREQLWEIYSKYNFNAAVKDCGPFTLTASDDLKDGWSHYYTSMILSEDIGKIFNNLDTNYCNKVYEMNTKLLNELGLALALAKNDYNLRNACYGLLEKLISQVIDEKRCWGGSSIGEPSAVSDLRDIGIAYRQGNYASAMGKYNKGYRLLELDEVKKNSELVADVKYCVGTILLWNLGDICSYHGLSAQGSWFEKNYSRRTGIGQILLIEAAKTSSKESVVRKNALVVTRKKY